MMTPISRRTLIGAGLALAACEGPARSQTTPQPLTALKAAAAFPVGSSLSTEQIASPGLPALFVRNFDQVTPEWEMKMERVLRPDGTFDFSAADAIAAFAQANGLRLHGHTLVWYAQDEPPAFRRIDGGGAAFANAYRNYILAVAGRYRGKVVGWDVVNEAVAESGDGYRDCLWRKNLGMDYVARAFRHAREADPTATLFLNDYNLETMPNKRASFMKLADQLQKAGAPLGGIGCQTHLSVEVRPGAVKTAIADLARLGLPIHISELDVSTRVGRLALGAGVDRLQQQARLVGEVGEAFAALPAKQRYAVTTWGVRDRDSWLSRPARGGHADDRPLLFDDAGLPKPAARAFVQAVTGRV